MCLKVNQETGLCEKYQEISSAVLETGGSYLLSSRLLGQSDIREVFFLETLKIAVCLADMLEHVYFENDALNSTAQLSCLIGDHGVLTA